MSEEDTNNDSREGDVPLDDYGINNDKMIDMVEFIINEAHDKSILKGQKDWNVEELLKLAETLSISWNVAQEIISLEDRIEARIRKFMKDNDIGDILDDDDINLFYDDDDQDDDPDDIEY